MHENLEPSLFESVSPISASIAPEPKPLPDWASRVAVFDLETTGLDLNEARIVTACVVLLDAEGRIISEEREWLANPGVPIPVAASNVHGITEEFARLNGAPAAEVVAEVLNTLRAYLAEGIPVVAYNAPYDFTILRAEALRHALEPLDSPMPILDPLVLDKTFERYRGGKRNLETVAALYGVELSDAHNATADAVAAGRVLQAIARKYSEKLPTDIFEVHQQQVAWSEASDSSYESFRRRTVPEFTVVRGWPTKPLLIES